MPAASEFRTWASPDDIDLSERILMSYGITAETGESEGSPSDIHWIRRRYQARWQFPAMTEAGARYLAGYFEGFRRSFYWNSSVADRRHAQLDGDHATAQAVLNLKSLTGVGNLDYGVILKGQSLVIYGNPDTIFMVTDAIRYWDAGQVWSDSGDTMYGLAYDATNDHVYVADKTMNRVRRADAEDGGNKTTVGTVTNVVGVAIDVANDDQWTVSDSTGNITHSALDGSGQTNIVTGLTTLRGIAVDTVNQRLYYADATKISRCEYDGSNPTDIITGLTTASGVAVDPAGSLLYWSDPGTGKVQRSTLAGASITDIVTGASATLYGIAIDVTAGRLWYAEKSPAETITSVDITDGTDAWVVDTETANHSGIALDTAQQRLFSGANEGVYRFGYWGDGQVRVGITPAIPSHWSLASGHMSDNTVVNPLFPESSVANRAGPGNHYQHECDETGATTYTQVSDPSDPFSTLT